MRKGAVGAAGLDEVCARAHVGWLWLALLAAWGCSGAGERSRAVESAVWVDSAAVPLQVADLARLEAGGIGELFVEGARLDWQVGQPQVAPLPLRRQPRRARAMLVVRGSWPAALDDPKSAASALVSALGAVSRNSEQADLEVAGYHLDLRGFPGEPAVELVQALRDALEPKLLLSATVPRSALAAEGIDELVDSTDFLAAFLYGVREGEADDPAAWDFHQVQAGARRLEELEEPYLIGVVVRGSAVLLHGGAEAGEITGATLADLAWNRRLRVRHGFSLEGVDRQVYSFTAADPTRVADTRLVAGDNVRVVGTSTAHMQELRRQIAGWKLQHYLGALYYRLPHRGEALTLSADSLARIAGEAAALPAPKVVVTKLGASTGRVVVKLTLVNRSSEASDLGQVDNNFVEMWAVGGAFGDVRVGQFFRYDTYATTPSGRVVRAIRFPTLLRFYAPLLPAGGSIESGPIEIRTVRAGLTDLQVRASFLAPYGGTADIPATSWMLLQPPPTPTPTPTPKPTPKPKRQR